MCDENEMGAGIVEEGGSDAVEEKTLSLYIASLSPAVLVEEMLATGAAVELVTFRKLAVLRSMGLELESGLSPLDMWAKGIFALNGLEKTEDDEYEQFAGVVMAQVPDARPMILWLAGPEVTAEQLAKFEIFWNEAQAKFLTANPEGQLEELVAHLHEYWLPEEPKDDILQ